jgi:hypothetical protein
MNGLPISPHSGDGPAPEVCPTCQHLMALHDSLSSRWCAATRLGVGQRECICSEVVRVARPLTHY